VYTFKFRSLTPENAVFIYFFPGRGNELVELGAALELLWRRRRQRAEVTREEVRAR
jgi:hypothetical protein